MRKRSIPNSFQTVFPKRKKNRLIWFRFRVGRRIERGNWVATQLSHRKTFKTYQRAVLNGTDDEDDVSELGPFGGNRLSFLARVGARVRNRALRMMMIIF